MTKEEIKEARARLGLSAAKFAALVGIAEGRTVYRWETGESDVPGPVAVLVESILESEDVRAHFGVTLREKV